VRVLIWQGAVDLIGAEPVRTLIGWGPESMHVAYNPYYPPELGRLESRNASPDRSHNETFDALVQMGVVGFLAYMALFTSLFTYGLKWLGFAGDSRWLRVFLTFWLGGGLVSALGFRLWSGNWTFFGVALPAGMVAGLFAFVALRALTGWRPPERSDALLIAGLVAALIAHFIEIHFGIAIAATRTMFFAMAAALVVVGHFGVLEPSQAEVEMPTPAPAQRGRRSA
jgi:O-antigen ligase